MALYENNLYLAKKGAATSLIAGLARSGDIYLVDQHNALILGGLSCYYRETTLNGTVLAQLMFADSQFEHLLQTRARDYLSWLWAVVEFHAIDYLFMGGGLAYAGYDSEKKITDAAVYGQLAELLERGIVRYPHPLMFFAEHLGGGELCRIAQHAPLYHVLSRPAVGCLLLLIDGDVDADAMEILEPGLVYPTLEAYFAHATRGL